MTMTMNFMVGGAMRKVVVKGRKISFLTPELNFVPLIIDLDKLDEQKERIEKMKMDKKYIKKLASLTTEKKIANDIAKDFKQSGWRLVYQDGIS
ncbi:hypothetical protein LCGC14_1459490 [marine sediment metagenome]|uniref:Uncharacterized protein n=1 Tax=marine sediment metagenome TaxID=412755 RepID=A0A0F9JFG7_9ZZZZ